MMYLFMLCQAELSQITVDVDMTHVQKEHRDIPASVLWLEQCVMKKAVWL
jgi:hypothetical protein